MRHELGLRVASSVVLIPVVIAATLLGGIWFQLLVAVALTLGAFEWARVTRLPAPALALLALTPAGVAFAFAFAGGLAALGLAALFAASAAVAAAGRRIWAGLGALYLSLPGVACLWLMATVEDGTLLMIWLLVSVWATDCCAYMVGRGVGGSRLAPRISPGKTWSGLLGGVAGAALLSVLFATYLQLAAPAILAGVAALLALVAQAGDLLKSAVKRHFGVKDFGRVIPGHGGVLDRIDGLMTAVPALALLVALTGLEQGPPGWR